MKTNNINDNILNCLVQVAYQKDLNLINSCFFLLFSTSVMTSAYSMFLFGGNELFFKQVLSIGIISGLFSIGVLTLKVHYFDVSKTAKEALQIEQGEDYKEYSVWKKIIAS